MNSAIIKTSKLAWLKEKTVRHMDCVLVYTTSLYACTVSPLKVYSTSVLRYSIGIYTVRSVVEEKSPSSSVLLSLGFEV